MGKNVSERVKMENGKWNRNRIRIEKNEKGKERNENEM